ncbi:hypothetical protein [Dyella sp. S184]|uniref:hypothetical protein n=1 Tax=Dyella sp. S184 TaxID=1641862 RepID=UPI00131BD9DD|nr:hypothetical protein [Dyella sp. S184]
MPPLPPEQRIKFFVFVIESPSAVDLYHRRSEGEIVRQAVELNGIKCTVKTAISFLAFDACLKVGLSEAMGQMPGFIPLLHISAHGDANGIQLSDGYNMSWVQLKDLLRPINQALGGSLVVCMSSCEGYSGTRMAMHPEESDLPYFALIGCGAQPTWGETAVAYATLYHQLWRGERIDNAVQAMRVACGNEFFFLEHAEKSRQNYIEYLNTVNPAQAQENLEQIVANESADNQQSLKLLR